MLSTEHSGHHSHNTHTERYIIARSQVYNTSMEEVLLERP
jgi:hypothetical protein